MFILRVTLIYFIFCHKFILYCTYILLTIFAKGYLDKKIYENAKKKFRFKFAYNIMFD